MDPDAALEEALAALDRFNPDTPPGDDVDNDSDGALVIERFQALHQWISNGGFLPAAWVKR